MSEDRPATSHERHAGRPWDESYQDGRPPWDLGRPQPAIAELAAEEGAFRGTVLDAGCGTGENALHLAAAGLSIVGIDVAETAVAQAKEKARDRGLAAEFAVGDAFRLSALNRTFDTVLDCGLFHTLDARERETYVASLASVTEPGARLHVLCFRDAGAGSGPHPVTRAEFEAPFTRETGWQIETMRDSRILARFAPDGLPAWLATIRRVSA
ncbi:class I SAM-dependent methyltransferase [Amycolatopsis echigonensis]|uniref:Class I SAM-dependent methyltransferase n=1 Tax=Amycolatopsis echigonensis TaxID=2576905 RepID=A0A2N3WU33_9PSEU|nr:MULTISPECIES: class I SAM-dependent methyltransferase [Amycolatopsis]MBB2503501.1 class I SAM-dependent methyltransferase [Amycolatopsis echigonensis]PKV97381.1 methyltransferase family protein [Amycolatopsis niigatensis]